jgi:chemotaxis protein methyltransferase CheR
MTANDFEFVSKLLLEQAAIVLEPGKEYLVDSRLTPVARRHGLSSPAEYIQKLRAPGANGLLPELVEAMVTTETSFFRDIHPFEALKKTVVPELIRARQQTRQLNIWCAAASSGQEPYTIALVLKEHFPELGAWKLFFLASDISDEMLRRCREGKFSQIEVNRGLPIQLLMKYFGQEGSHWRAHDHLRAMIEFRQINLAGPWGLLPQLDLVFLRNVMIYFNVETKKSILRRVARLLRPDGYLVLGGAETTFNLDDSYQRVEALKSGYYRLTGK